MDWRNVIPVWQDEPWSMHFNSAYTKCAHFVLRILCSHRTFRVETCVSSLHPRDLGKDFQERLDNLSHEQDWIFIWGTSWDEIWSVRSQRQDLRSSVDFFNLLGCDVETRSPVDGCCEGRGRLGWEDLGRMFVLDLIVCMGQHCIQHTATRCVRM